MIGTTYQESIGISGRPWWEVLADRSYLIMFLLLAVPETLTGKIYVGPFPIYFAFFYMGLAASFIELVISGRPLVPLVRGALALCGLMVLHGLARGHSIKYLIIDMSSFIGLIAGLHWASTRGQALVVQWWRWWALAFVFLLAFAIIGLKLGFITPSRVSGRLYVYSAFRCTFFLAIILPALWGAMETLPGRSTPHWMQRFWPVCGVGVIIMAAVFMATRSVLLEGLMVGFLLFRISFREQRALMALLLMLAVGAVGVVMALDFAANTDIGQLAERLQSTKGGGETRWIEVLMLLDQMQFRDYLFGMGFGSQFESIVVVHGSNLALHPHIAVFAFLQKGGIGLLLAVIIVPALIHLWRLVRGKGSAQQLGWWSGAVMFIVMACMSSAWEFFFLFLYGVSSYFSLCPEVDS